MAANLHLIPGGSRKIQPSTAIGNASLKAGAAAKAIGVHALEYVRGWYEKVKGSDTIFGRIFTWVDENVEKIQEAIGGKQQDHIDGNELKDRVIKWIKENLGKLEKAVIPGHDRYDKKPVLEQLTPEKEKDIEATLDRVGDCDEIEPEPEDEEVLCTYSG
ncbi:hypothetical protein CDD80_4274 [Ophiocordyceps camponoti-rufipedis]|uniref:Uncharacterized protein n=1 Tax=Ophiocordyceps camponoti-rufipedis TaxID=2004952 RepID=A0A2C5YVI4_9HYPO|nr:hypothetical protein CDD80_4274 [Ophiocordyceps camponoti-rufipedis]